jgi:hypothetical protein
MNVRPAFLLFVLSALCFWAAPSQADAASCEWNADCISWNYDKIGGPPDGIVSYRIETAKAASGPWTAVTTIAAPTMAYKRSAVAGTNYYRVITNYIDGLASEPSVVSNPSTAVPPLLLTEGGLVWMASPNYTTFGWKLGSTAGTIAAGIKCDATRRIGDDYYRVTGPIVWTAGKKNYVVAKCQEAKEFG